jgi:hypothetical protein
MYEIQSSAAKQQAGDRFENDLGMALLTEADAGCDSKLRTWRQFVAHVFKVSCLDSQV